MMNVTGALLMLTLASVAAYSEKNINGWSPRTSHKVSESYSVGRGVSPLESLLKKVERKSSSKREEYVTMTQFTAAMSGVIEDITTVISTVDQTHALVLENTNSITANYNTLSAADSSMSTSINSLQNLYDTATVRKCLSGLITGACGSTCGDEGEDSPNGATHTITFSPAFHTAPKVLASFQQYDDAGSEFRFKIEIVPSAGSMTIQLRTWSDSKIYSASIFWIACA